MNMHQWCVQYTTILILNHSWCIKYIVNRSTVCVILLDPVLLHFVRYDNISSRLACFFASCHSSVWFVKSHRTTPTIFDSNRQPLLRFRKQLRRIWSDCSPTLTCVRFMHVVSQSRWRIFTSHDDCAEREHRSRWEAQGRGRQMILRHQTDIPNCTIVVF